MMAIRFKKHRCMGMVKPFPVPTHQNEGRLSRAVTSFPATGHSHIFKLVRIAADGLLKPLDLLIVVDCVKVSGFRIAETLDLRSRLTAHDHSDESSCTLMTLTRLKSARSTTAMNFEQLIKFGVDQGASGIHLQAESPPQLRLGGLIRNVEGPPVKAEDLRAFIASIAPKPERRRSRSVAHRGVGLLDVAGRRPVPLHDLQPD